MAYIGNLPPSVTNIKNADIASDAAISISKLDGVTSSSSDLNVLAGADAAGVTGTELQHLNGVTSNIQTQLTAASGGATKGTLTKSFVTGETSTIALSSASTPTASVFVTKEISQDGVTNGDWNVNANDTGYDIEDFAYAENLTIDTTNSTATLASSPWSEDDVGKKIVGGGGEAILIATDGTVYISDLFDTANPTLTSGSWNFYGVNLSGTGASLMRGDGQAFSTFDHSLATVFQTEDLLNHDTFFGAGTSYRLRFNSDGTIIFVLYTTGLIHKASLDNPYDLSSANNLTKSSWTSGFNNARDFTLNSDGTVLFLLDNADTIRSYTLSSAYDISSPTALHTFSTASETTNRATKISLADDDKTMLVLDDVLEVVFQYGMTTVSDLTTMSFSSKSLNVSTLDSNTSYTGYNGVHCMATDPAMTKLYILTSENFTSAQPLKYVRTYKYTTTKDVGTAKIVNGNAPLLDSMFGITVDNSGKNLFTLDSINTLYKYAVSKPYEIINRLGAYDSGPYEGEITNYGTAFAPQTTILAKPTKDGRYGIYLTHDITSDDVNLRIIQLADRYRVESYILSTQTIFTINPSTPSFSSGYVDAHLSPDGTKFTMTGSTANITTNSIAQYTLSTPFDASTAGSFTTKTTTYLQLFDFNSDGTRLYLANRYNSAAGGKVYQYNLTTPYDISSFSNLTIGSANATFDKNADAVTIAYGAAGGVVARSETAYAFSVLDDSSYVYINTYSTTAHVIKYTMSTPNDITTSYIAEANDFGNLNSGTLHDQIVSTNFEPILVTEDGSTLVADKILIPLPGVNQFSDYATRVAIATDSLGYSVLGQDTVSMALNSNESKSYHLQSTGVVSEYNFGTAPHGLVGATSTGNTFNATVHETTPTSITFNADGTLMFIAGNTTDSVYSYILTSGFDLSTATTTNYKSASLAVEVADLREIMLSSDGTKLYALDATTKSIYQYGLSTAFDLDTLTYDSVVLSLAESAYNLTAVESMYLDPSNTSLVVLGQHTLVGSLAQGILAPYSLPTPKILTGAIHKGHKPTQKSTFKTIVGEPTGKRLYVGNAFGVDIINMSANLVNASVTPLNQYLSAVTNSINRINTEYWTDINSMAALNTVANSGSIYFAVSTDTQATFKVASNNDGIRTIVRNNSGTWEYNSNATYGSETWASATGNTKFRALEEAMAVAANRMTASQLQGVSDNNHFVLGDNLDLAIILHQATVGTPPISDGVSINYDAQALNKGAILGTDYDYDVPSNTSVRITSLKDHNLKVKVV